MGEALHRLCGSYSGGGYSGGGYSGGSCSGGGYSGVVAAPVVATPVVAAPVVGDVVEANWRRQRGGCGEAVGRLGDVRWRRSAEGPLKRRP